MISYRCSIGTDTLSPTEFDILRFKYIEVTTLTFLGHVTSSTMWPFVTHYMISYKCSVDADPLSWSVFEILSLIGIWVATLTFQGHVTSKISWPFDSPYTISYRCSIGTDTLSATDFKTLIPNISRSRLWPLKVTWHHRPRDHSSPTIWFPIGAPLTQTRYLELFLRY